MWLRKLGDTTRHAGLASAFRFAICLNAMPAASNSNRLGSARVARVAPRELEILRGDGDYNEQTCNRGSMSILLSLFCTTSTSLHTSRRGEARRGTAQAYVASLCARVCQGVKNTVVQCGEVGWEGEGRGRAK